MPIKSKNKSLSQRILSLGVKSRSPFARIVAAAVLATMTIGTADAQTDAQRIADLELKLKSALTVIDKLADKMDRLEKNNTATAISKVSVPDTTIVKTTDANATKTVADQNSRIDTLQQQVSQMTSTAKRIIPFDWLHGFADVGGGYSTNGHPSGFSVGNLDFYLTPKIGGKVRTLVELVFEYDRVGGLGTDMERVQVGYAFNDQATVWLGRFHTPYGYWQTAYHHGAQIQPSLLRPRFLDFEDKGGFMPAHSTGAWATGGVQTTGGKVTYDFWLANSYSLLPNSALGNGTQGVLDHNSAGFSNPSLTVGAKLSYIFSRGLLDGLNIGINGYRAQVQIKGNYGNTPTAGPTSFVQTNVAGAYLYYNNHDWEIISEAYKYMNEDQTLGTGTHDSWAAYIHAGYQINQWMPYVRLENANTNKNDPYFNSLAYGYAYSREAAGIRYDVNSQSSLKLELNYTQPLNNPNSLNEFWESRVQYAVRF